jgi:hypothetical protein
MPEIKEIHRLSFCIFFCSVLALSAAGQYNKEFYLISAEQITDKIRGGMLGQMIGNLNGIEHEMAYIDEPGDVKNYIPSLENGAWTDDDTDFEWVYILEMQKYRNAFLPADTVYRLWQERINRRIWFSNRFARHLMTLGLNRLSRDIWRSIPGRNSIFRVSFYAKHSLSLHLPCPGPPRRSH